MTRYVYILCNCLHLWKTHVWKRHRQGQFKQLIVQSCVAFNFHRSRSHMLGFVHQIRLVKSISNQWLSIHFWKPARQCGHECEYMCMHLPALCQLQWTKHLSKFGVFARQSSSRKVRFVFTGITIDPAHFWHVASARHALHSTNKYMRSF